MKKLFAALFTASIFFAACHNDGSSTVGTYESQEESSSTEHKEGQEKTEMSEGHHEVADTTKTIEHKTDISVDNNGVDVQTKSFNKDSTHH